MINEVRVSADLWDLLQGHTELELKSPEAAAMFVCVNR